jgi:hypothetical protein
MLSNNMLLSDSICYNHIIKIMLSDIILSDNTMLSDNISWKLIRGRNPIPLIHILYYIVLVLYSMKWSNQYHYKEHIWAQ